MISMKKKNIDVIMQGNNIVYIITSFIAVICIFISYVSTNLRQVETIFKSWDSVALPLR